MPVTMGKCINRDQCLPYMNYKYGNFSHNNRSSSKPEIKLTCPPSIFRVKQNAPDVYHSPNTSCISFQFISAATVNAAAVTVLQVLWAILNVLTQHISCSQNCYFNVISGDIFTVWGVVHCAFHDILVQIFVQLQFLCTAPT